MDRFCSLFLASSLVAAACTNDVTFRDPPPEDEGFGGSGAGGGMTGGGGTTVGQPPPPPDDAGPGPGPGATLAFDKLFMGDTDLNGSPSPSAWKTYGFNLDGQVSNCVGGDCSSITTLCTPNAGGSPSSIYPDGDNGIDNAFGKLLLPIFMGLSQNFAADVNAAIAAGEFTYIIDLPSIGPDPNYIGLPSLIYEGSNMAAIPMFDGSDLWPVTAASLAIPGDLSSALLQDGQSYLNNNTWVGRPSGTLELRILTASLPFVFPIQNPIITMKLSADRQSVESGVIGGVVATEVLISELQKLAGSFDPDLCTGTTFESLADQFRQASDILLDGTQDPNKVCDAISIGLGFTASAVEIGPVAAPVSPPPDPCAP